MLQTTILPDSKLCALSRDIQTLHPVSGLFSLSKSLCLNLQSSRKIAKIGAAPNHSSIPLKPPSLLYPDWHYSEQGLLIDGREQLDVDHVVLCTGYDGVGKLAALLPAREVERLTEHKDGMHLYRYVEKQLRVCRAADQR
jgi:hypothetical protein